MERRLAIRVQELCGGLSKEDGARLVELLTEALDPLTNVENIKDELLSILRRRHESVDQLLDVGC